MSLRRLFGFDGPSDETGSATVDLAGASPASGFGAAEIEWFWADRSLGPPPGTGPEADPAAAEGDLPSPPLCAVFELHGAFGTVLRADERGVLLACCEPEASRRRPVLLVRFDEAGRLGFLCAAAGSASLDAVTLPLRMDGTDPGTAIPLLPVRLEPTGAHSVALGMTSGRPGRTKTAVTYIGVKPPDEATATLAADRRAIGGWEMFHLVPRRRTALPEPIRSALEAAALLLREGGDPGGALAGLTDLVASGLVPAPVASDTAAEPVICCALKGKPGNAMFVYLAALRLRERLGAGRIVGAHIPMWDIDGPDEERENDAATLRLDERLENLNRSAVPFDGIVAQVRSGRIGRVELAGYCQSTVNLPRRDTAAKLFDGARSDAEGYGDDTLLISLRGAEILKAIHPEYTLLPVGFYVDLVRRTGLKPVFFGQIGDDPYVASLRAALPDAVFRAGQDPLHDFEVIRRSRNICLSISTFSWLAAWLSDASRIVLPLCGLFHPNQHKAGFFVPRGDPRYELVLFPITRAVEMSRLPAAHLAIEGRWQWIDETALDRLVSPAPRFARRLDQYLACFDEAHYVRSYPVRSPDDGLTPMERFVSQGFWAGHVPFPIDRQWYCETYPDAAVAIGQNDHADEAHHYVSIGRDRSYRPLRPD